MHADLLIRQDDLADGNIIEALHEHREEMLSFTPPESVHALDEAQLHSPEITFWSAWCDGQFCACGALKNLGDQHGELKSMRTKADFLRQGIAQAVLLRIIEHAQQAGFKRLSLETGVQDYFIAARKLYQRHGFVQCGPFANYKPDPLSYFMMLEL